MIFVYKILLCITMITSLSLGADYPYETQSPSSHTLYAESESWNVSEQAISTFQQLGRSIYNHRHLILTASLAYIAISEIPMVGASLLGSLLFPDYCTFDPIAAARCRQMYGSGYLYDACCMSD
jgi:hypothetical protein